MILNFKYNKKNNTISWRFKAQSWSVKISNPKIVKCYEYLDKIFVITLKNKVSTLLVYDAEGKLYDEVVSTDEFFIGGIREGIINPEFIIHSKGQKPKIFIYEPKKKTFKDTGEIVNK